MVRKRRLTNTAKVIIVIGVGVLVLGGIFSIPNLGINAQPDIGIFTDQLSLSDDYLPFPLFGSARGIDPTTTTTIDTTNTIDAITASQVSTLLKELPSNCGLKLQTTIVFDDNSRQVFSTGATSFAPIQALSLVTTQGQVIKQFETVPLLRCPEVIGVDGTRHGYVHEWLQGVNVKWDAYKQDGTLFIENSRTGLNTASVEAGGATSFFGLVNNAPKCGQVVFEDVGDVKATGLYSDAQIKRWQETFGGSTSTGIFIGSERAICAKDVNGVVAEPFIITADELEQRIESAGKEFETTLIIKITFGNSLLEIPFLSQELGQPFVANNGIDQFITKQFLSFTVDNLADTTPAEEDIVPAPEGVQRGIRTISFNPVKIDIANLEEKDRTVTWRIALNSYDQSEGTPSIVVKADQTGQFGAGLFPSGTTASFLMKDAGISGDDRLFEGEWIVQTGQTLGSYQLTVSMISRTNDVVKIVEVVQKAQDAPKDTPVGGQCKSGQQLVEDKGGTNICVAECAGDLIWDKFASACAIEAVCTGDLKIITAEDGSKSCGKDPIPNVPDDQKCDPELTFNSETNKCEVLITDPPFVCKQGEQLVNTGGGRTSCIPELPDFIKLLTPIACTDKFGITDDGFCLPPTLVVLFQNPIQLVYIGIGLIVVILVLKFLFGAVRRQGGGLNLTTQ